MRPLKIGLIGCGMAAVREILPRLTADQAPPTLTVAAVCDRDPGRAARVAAQFSIKAYFDDHHVMLSRSDVDLVVIATPIPSHAAIALDAIAADKHVCVQKT